MDPLHPQQTWHLRLLLLLAPAWSRVGEVLGLLSLDQLRTVRAADKSEETPCWQIRERKGYLHGKGEGSEKWEKELESPVSGTSKSHLPPLSCWRLPFAENRDTGGISHTPLFKFLHPHKFTFFRVHMGHILCIATMLARPYDYLKQL